MGLRHRLAGHLHLLKVGLIRKDIGVQSRIQRLYCVVCLITYVKEKQN